MKIPYSVINHLDHAIYLPALQTQYTQGVVQPKAFRPLPNGATLKDLNFFEPNSKFFNINAALYSAGLINNKKNPPKCMVTQRVRCKNQDTLIMGDSGGYQIMSQNRLLSASERLETYQWLVNTCDLAMTLDVPTAGMYKGTSIHYPTFDDCLLTTFRHLYAFNNYGAKNEYFLNVLQGHGLHHQDLWYDVVKRFDFYGWAFAGEDKTTMKLVLYRILALIEDGKFDKDETWLHFLGVGDLKTAVLLTTLRDVLRHKFPHCRIEVSYDTSSPFLAGGKNLTALDKPKITSNRMTIPSVRVDKSTWAGSNAPFPCKGSEISKYLTKGDIIIKDWRGVKRPDNLGYLMLQNHNVEVQINSIDAIHQILKRGLTKSKLRPLVPTYLLEAQDAIADVLLQPTPKQGRSKLFDPQTLLVLDNAYANGHPQVAKPTIYTVTSGNVITINSSVKKATIQNTPAPTGKLSGPTKVSELFKRKGKK
ncbi:MAG: hypothetical protein JKY45_04075 [Emcibacter sp.]|nr:hypothetical protein [Emcibacter sp.]